MPRQRGKGRGQGRGQGHCWWREDSQQAFQRMTVPRRLILDVLYSTTRHLSAEEVYFEVVNQYPQIGLATVYRNLEFLVQQGLVSRFDFGDRRSRYELIEKQRGAEHHHHLVCTRCGKIINYTDFIDDEVELLQNTEKGLAQKYDFEITNHIIQFYGICGDCRRK